LNFWEEFPDSDSCGVLRILETRPVSLDSGEGIKQTLRWERNDGEMPTYKENRVITLRMDEESGGFLWTFQTERTSLRPHRLIMSEWSHTKADGTRVNYHGLGIRLPWPWSVSFCRTLTVDGEEKEDLIAASGATPNEVKMEGALDGDWTPSKASVSLSQPAQQAFGLFAIAEPFPYLSLGPSNLSPFDVSEGDQFSETYTILIRDESSTI
jgi:hypothetical protein